MEGRAVAYGALQLTQTAISIGFSIWLVVGLKLGWRGGIAAQVVAICATGLLAGWLLHTQGWVRWKIVPAYIRNALGFGVPLIPHTMGATLIAMTDRVLIAKLVGVAEMGVYTVGYQVAMVIALLQNSFNQAWVPWAYKALKRGGITGKREMVRITYIYFVVILLAAGALAVIAPTILRYAVDRRYADATKYVFWIGLGYAFNGMYKMVSVHIFYHAKTHWLAGVTAFTAVLNVGLIYWGVRMTGAVGAAQATAAAFFVSFALTWLLSQKVQPLPWNLRRRSDSPD
jgi:O-antigen/teichoic acid export membrane protein